MKKGQIYEGRVTRVDFPNKGILDVEDKRVIVKNAIPGQKIRFSISKKRGEKAEGRLLEVLEPSELETRDKACKSFGACGGCSYQTMAYEKQLEMKKDQVIRLLDQVCSGYEFEGILGSPKEWEYRNKMEFSFGDEFKGGPLALGLHKRGSFHDILTVDDCRIVDKDFNMILSCVLDYCSELGLNYYHKLSHKGYLRHLLVRKAVKTGEILINIITTSQEDFKTEKGNKREEGFLSNENSEIGTENDNIVIRNQEQQEQQEYQELWEQQENQKSKKLDMNTGDIFAPLVQILLELPLFGKVVGIHHTFNDSKADVVQCDRMETLYGRDYIYEELLGLRFKISTFSFFQTNSLGAEVLYSKVREYVGETKDRNIFDLYSGTGTIAQLLAPVAEKVTGVEIVEEAVEAARENAALNGLTNCEFIAGDVLKVIDSLEDKPDIIVLDPPRDGIHPKALEKISASIRAKKIVYISCKPTSLARDLVLLQENGYKVNRVCAVDMFPNTVHVESTILMTYCGSKEK